MPSAGSDELKLEIARTCHVLAMGTAAASSAASIGVQEAANEGAGTAVQDAAVCSGYLWKKSNSSPHVKEAADQVEAVTVAAATVAVWYRRWFCLRQDNCLYYYKNEESSQPLGAVSLIHYTASRAVPADERACGLALMKGGLVRHWLAAESDDSADLWQSHLNHASRSAVQVSKQSFDNVTVTVVLIFR